MKFTLIKYILVKQNSEKKEENKKQNKKVITEYSPTKGKVIIKI